MGEKSQGGFSLKIPVRILGIPLSLSCSGYLCPKEELEFFSRTLDKFPLLLILNTEKELDLPTARTLGTYELDLTKEIVFSGNSRIRLKKARKRGAELSFREMLPSEFGAAHFALNGAALVAIVVK